MKEFSVKESAGALVAILVVLGFSGAATAQGPSAAEILEKMERMMNGFEDQKMDVMMVVVDTDGSRKSYDFTIYQKGDVKRLVTFTSGELKGMATLVEDQERIYAYLPGFKKVRRVAAHNMNQTVAGSDFSSQDMANVSWTRLYDVKFDSEDDESWLLDALPKQKEGAAYARALVRVDKKSFNQVGVVYFNEAGEKVKVFSSSQIRDFDGVPRATLVVLTDPRTGHRTELHIKDFRFNMGLGDDLFTVRQLQASR